MYNLIEFIWLNNNYFNSCIIPYLLGKLKYKVDPDASCRNVTLKFSKFKTFDGTPGDCEKSARDLLKLVSTNKVDIFCGNQIPEELEVNALSRIKLIMKAQEQGQAGDTFQAQICTSGCGYGSDTTPKS